jgi:hypothetical protein
LEWSSARRTVALQIHNSPPRDAKLVWGGGVNWPSPLFEPARSVHSSKDADACVLTIVNTANGKRVIFAASLLEEIGLPKAVDIMFNAEGMAIISGSKFKLREADKKGIIYSSQLVEEITERFTLDFSGSKISISFPELRILPNGDNCAAFVPLRP